MGTILRWLHLSDIHFGHGDARYGHDQSRVLNALSDDLKALIAANHVPAPDYVFLTGDIAFSAAAQRRSSSDEYEAAFASLHEISRAVQVPFERFLLVPGNHDVRRFQPTPAWFSSMNSGPDSSSLEDLGESEQLILNEREEAFMRFARRINSSCAYPDWEHTLKTTDHVVRVIGWDTAVLANGRDLGRLQVRPNAVTQLRMPAENELTILLTHHPFTDGWLTNEQDMNAAILGKVHVHLSGHIHRPRIRQIISGDGGSILTLQAGAVHNDAIPDKLIEGVSLRDWIEPSHAYSFGQLLQHDNGSIGVEVFPRRWHAGARGNFRWDVGILPDHSFTASHVVKGRGRGQLPSAPKIRSTIEDLTGEVSPSHRLPFRDSLSAHLIDQLPSRAGVSTISTLFLLNEQSDNVLLNVKIQVIKFTTESCTEIRCRAVSASKNAPCRRVYLSASGSIDLVMKGENAGERFKLDVGAGDHLVIAVAYTATLIGQDVQLSDQLVKRDWFCIEIGDLAERGPLTSFFAVCAHSARISFRSIYEFRLAESRPVFEQLRPSPAALESCDEESLKCIKMAARRAAADIHTHSKCFGALEHALESPRLWTADLRSSQSHDLAYIAELTPRQ